MYKAALKTFPRRLVAQIVWLRGGRVRWSPVTQAEKKRGMGVAIAVHLTPGALSEAPVRISEMATILYPWPWAVE